MEEIVMPECLYRASNRPYGDRFPLKACGNDIGKRSSSKHIVSQLFFATSSSPNLQSPVSNLQLPILYP